jgi:hypothetical protein
MENLSAAIFLIHVALKCHFATLLVIVFLHTAFEGMFVIMTLLIWLCHVLK